MTERINKALSEVEEEIESATNIIAYTAGQIKKEISSGRPIIELIKAIKDMSLQTQPVLDEGKLARTLRDLMLQVSD